MKQISEKAWVKVVAPLIYKFNSVIKTTDSIDIAKSAYDLYNSDTRKYHSAYHPLWMLKKADELGLDLSLSQKIAIVFHDVIYIRGSDKNEEASATWVQAVFSPFIENKSDFKIIAEVTDIILDTKQHFNKITSLRNDISKIVLDLDISNMAAPYAEFVKWNDAVEEEFADTPAQARIDFLQSFLKKKKIFLSDEFSDKEEKLRENLSRIIAEKEEALSST